MTDSLPSTAVGLLLICLVFGPERADAQRLHDPSTGWRLQRVPDAEPFEFSGRLQDEEARQEIAEPEDLVPPESAETVPESPESRYRLGPKPIAQMRTDIRPPEGRLPSDVAARHYGTQEEVVATTEWTPRQFNLASLSFCHQPLYFEEVYVERYGRHWGCLQPAASAVYFYGNLAILPYKARLYHPHSCVCSKGHCLCGRHEWLPLRLDAALAQAAFIAGTALIAP